MIRFENVSKTYSSGSDQVIALENISFQIKEGEFVSVVGKSGSGKTTLVKLLLVEENPTEGRVFFKGTCVGDMCQGSIQTLRRKIGVVHQDYRLLQEKTVGENANYIMQVIGAGEKEIERDVPQVLEIVGLLERENSFPEELSGGEKQRLAIARALVHRPEIIVADEPTGNLDLYNTYEIVNLLKKIHQLGTTVILLTHNKEVVDNLEKRVITLEEGKLIRDDPKGKFIL